MLRYLHVIDELRLLLSFDNRTIQFVANYDMTLNAQVFDQ